MPIIKKPNQHFDAVLWTGNGPSSQNITSLNFQPDLVWVKNRSSTRKHNAYDSVRGTSKRLVPDDVAVEDTVAGVTAFNSNGFTVGDEGDVNASTLTFVGWTWKAGGASTVNTSGTISSNVSVNTTAGFSVVTYTGNGSNNATIGHGLGATPAMIFIKRRDSGSTSSWPVWHKTYTLNTQYLLLDEGMTIATYSTYWGTHSSSVISLGTAVGEDNTNGGTYVAYCWSEVEGYSKFGSYTDGPFVYCGFKPKFVMFKNTATTQNWIIMDTARDTKNKMTQWLSPNTTGAEYTDSNIDVDFLSNGFKIRTSIGTELNGNGNAIIFAAFAESPFKYANAR